MRLGYACVLLAVLGAPSAARGQEAVGVWPPAGAQLPTNAAWLVRTAGPATPWLADQVAQGQLRAVTGSGELVLRRRFQVTGGRYTYTLVGAAELLPPQRRVRLQVRVAPGTLPTAQAVAWAGQLQVATWPTGAGPDTTAPYWSAKPTEVRTTDAQTACGPQPHRWLWCPIRESGPLAVYWEATGDSLPGGVARLFWPLLPTDLGLVPLPLMPCQQEPFLVPGQTYGLRLVALDAAGNTSTPEAGSLVLRVPAAADVTNGAARTWRTRLGWPLVVSLAVVLGMYWLMALQQAWGPGRARGSGSPPGAPRVRHAGRSLPPRP